MRVLVAHAYYRQRGGEDAVFEDEAQMLEAHGHDVARFTVRNDDLDESRPLTTAVRVVWNRGAVRDVREMIRASDPEVAHFHNTFPGLSPAVLAAAHAEGLPVVMTLHNYRLLCANALLFRNGRPCEDCVGRHVAWPAIHHRCYRESRAATTTVAAMLATHRLLRTWDRNVDAFVTPTEFARRKLVEAGLPAAKVVAKPNFVAPDPGVGPGHGGYAAFVGRLSPEKGISMMLRAWEPLGRLLPLRIAGDGPLAPEVEAAAARLPGVSWLGRLTADEVAELVADAQVLVLPSEWYETFGRVAIEAFACGTPVLASRLGAMAELVEHRRTGMLFEPGSAPALRSAVEEFLGFPEEVVAAMRAEARRKYESRYTAEVNYEILAGIYAGLGVT